jgi:hypothetical protein
MRGRAAIFLGNPLVRAAVHKRVVPGRQVGYLGCGIGWFVWLSLVGLLAMLVFRRQFGVVL